MTKPTALNQNPIIIIFIIQISLLLIMTILFFVGLSTEFQLGDFWFAIIMGGLGSSVALTRKRNESKLALTGSTGRIAIVIMVPILYGTIMAGVTYILFMSHILSGDGGGGLVTTNIFPNFTNLAVSSQAINITDLVALIDSTKTISISDLIDMAATSNSLVPDSDETSKMNLMEQFMQTSTVTITDTGKLLVWCFIAGYSENFITGILSNIESRMPNQRQGRSPEQNG